MMLKARGADVSGSDMSDSEELAPLRSAGIPIATGQSIGGLPEDRNLVVYSAAIAPDHPELLEAQRRGVETISYAEALGRVQRQRTGISIAGTHGKSTTSAMLSYVLEASGLDPSVIVGAVCTHLNGGWRVGAETIPGDGPRAGAPGLMVSEACEFNRSFHHHSPVLALINNIEEDHLDIYGGIEEIVTAFKGFAERLPARDNGGVLLIAHDGAHRREITAGLACAIETFGFAPEADWTVTHDAVHTEVTHAASETQLRWHAPMPGAHNALNAAAAVILALRSGAESNAVSTAIEAFPGLDRRMQQLGERHTHPSGTVRVLDDYGHHPTEIEATLRAIQSEWHPKRIICVFQPHQHSRTRFLLDEFASSFDAADIVIVPHIYFVRDSEAERHRVSAADLVDKLRARGRKAMHMHPFGAIVEHLEVLCRDGDLVVVMGAGDVWTIGRDFLRAGTSS